MKQNLLINQPVTQEMIDFTKDKMKRHIEAVNYLASLIGRNYPDHDSDKLTAPLLNIFAIEYWYKFKTDTPPVGEDREAFHTATISHYKNSAHHGQYWKNPHDMPFDAMEEMACDMFAMYAEKEIRGKLAKHYLDYWAEDQPKWFPYSPAQDVVMRDLFAKLESRCNRDNLLNIWK